MDAGPGQGESGCRVQLADEELASVDTHPLMGRTPQWLLHRYPPFCGLKFLN
jgi:hypothetical protein